jgi:hypothetical protein
VSSLGRPVAGDTALQVPSGRRPVLLATLLAAPFDPAAAEFAVAAAVETGRALIVAIVVELAPLPLSLILGHDQIDSPARSA